MELLFNLIKLMVANLSPTEFVLTMIIVMGVVAMLLKYVIKIISKRGGLADMFKDSDADPMKEIARRMDALATRDGQNVVLEKILTAIHEVKTQSSDQDVSIRAQITDILLLKKDVEALNHGVNKELEEIKSQLKSYDSASFQNMESMKGVMQRMQDLAQKLIIQIDKIDELTRAAIPEFRGYHKELTKDVSDLSRDIALVERSIQTHMNNASAINLR